MTNLNRRQLFGVAGGGVVGAMMVSTPRAARADLPRDGHPTFERLRQQVEASLRSVYRAKNDLDLSEFLSSFDDGSIYQDAILGISIAGLENIEPLFAGLFRAIAMPGRLSEFTYATGDAKLGAVAEYVDLPKSFTSTAYDALTILDLRDGQIVRDTDYWDSAQLSAADIFGPASQTGIAFPVVPVHPDGPLNPRSAPGFAIAASDSTHASPEFMEFVTRFHKELSDGNSDGAARLFTDDALLVHPLLHRGDHGYGPFDETIQIRGADNILRMLKAGLRALPDGSKSQLLHIVGGAAGGGFEWRAGGDYATKGLDRKGIRGATSIELFRGRIRRLSVKFDTMQMTGPVRDSVRQVLANASLGQDD